MFEQFYKYIVKTLMIGFFKRVSNKQGDRYYVIIDDKNADGSRPLEMFNKALAEVSEEIVLSGVFPASQNGVHEETYTTRMIKLPEPFSPIIIGFGSGEYSATEDYLVTMRNSIGEPGSKYEKYSSLFVLSEKPHDASNPLSSICTTCTDLKSPGKPLSVDYVVNDIRGRADSAFERDHERLYFKVYLEEVSKRIEDGSSTLYDLMPALSALQEGSVTARFNELGYFPDLVVSDRRNHLSDEQIRERAETNFEIYQKVTDVMSREDEADKVELLLKVLDEKLAKKIGNCTDEVWKKIDFQEILGSLDRKRNSDNLELTSYSLKEEGLASSLKCKVIGRWNKKTTIHAIVCDRSQSGLMHLRLQFNKRVQQRYLNDDVELEAHGKNVLVSVPTVFSKMHIIGKNDNHHDVLALSIPCADDFLSQTNGDYLLTKKGEILIQTPSDKGVLSFGSGIEIEQVLPGATVAYSEQKQYQIQLDEDAEEDYQIGFRFDFNGVVVGFIVKVKVDVTSLVDPVENPEKRDCYCRWEDTLIKNHATRLVVENNDLQSAAIVLPQFDAVDSEVSDALNKLYDYYSTQKAGPTLLGIDDISRRLFETYLDVVIQCLSKIQNGDSLTPQKYYLTKLGVVEREGKVYFSSFHPLMVAYLLEYESQRDITEEEYKASELLTPFYLAPFIRYNDIPMRPCWDPGLKEYKNWLCYDEASVKPQDRALDITTRMVCSKMQEFIRHFSYLFQDRDCPIIISTIGIENDRNVIKGILQFIMKEYKKGVQRIELHEYIPNLMCETFFEKLNRLVSTDLIVKELEALGEKIEKKGEFTSQEIIHQLFSRVVMYKHLLGDAIQYCHVAFYQMDTGTNYKRFAMNYLRGELAFNGLVSIPSTINREGRYLIGFGIRGVEQNPSKLYTAARLFNNLYANEENNGTGAYQTNVCLVKDHVFSGSALLNSIYANANWVTFLNPEVDIDFFYKQDLYVVHYTDQYSINAKYDSITVTRQINQYDNMLKRAYDQLGLSAESVEVFNRVMAKYFNCLNGNWLLSFVNKTEAQINEKMSLVAASIVMQRFMRRNEGVIWIPVSLEEILRVTGSIKLPKHFIFTKEDLGASGSMSDDLLMMGLDARDPNDLGMYLYPIEVKLSKNNSFSEKGGEQVSHTYQQMHDHLFGEDNFTKKIFKVFFASQFLVNAEKLNANGLLDRAEYAIIDKYRYRLLNLKYRMLESLPVAEMGNAALVSFYSQAQHSICTSTVEGANICEIHFSSKECFEVVADPDSTAADFLEHDPIDWNCDEEVSCDAEGVEEGVSDIRVEQTVGEDVNAAERETDNITTADVVVSSNAEATGVAEVVVSARNDEDATISASGMKIVLGSTIATHREIIFEPNNTRLVSHPNMGIIGTMGTGKTQFARSVIAQLAKSSGGNVGGLPVGVLIFDYKGDYKDEPFLLETGGTSYKYNYPFNPLKLIVTPGLDGVNLPAVTADRISDSFAKAYGLGLRQQGNIKQVIIDTYADFGITRDPGTWGNPVPTMDNVIEKYFATYDANDKAYVLFDKLRDYTIFATSNDACVSIFEWLDRVRVIDLTLYPDDTKKVIVSLILDLFYAEMKQLGESKQENGYRQLRSFIVVDEAHQFLKKDFNSLRSIISEGRMFGVGMILSTQNLGDFRSTNEDYSQFILSWVIHHVNSISKSEIASIFGATDTNAERYMDRINHARLFESVCKIGSNVNAMRDLPFFELVAGRD